MRTPPVALTIAGSDPGGGAGVQADLATFAAYGVHGTSALTAVTVQDTTGVHGIHALPAGLVLAQADAVLGDLPVAAVKTGMLRERETVQAVASLAAAGRLPRLVVDPVIVSTSGHSLTGPEAVAVLMSHLLPHAALITPNVEEAAALLGAEPAVDLAAQRAQARALLTLGPAAVVVTGGLHDGGRVDVLAVDGRLVELHGPTIATSNDHGTGCTFAAAVAAALACGAPLEEAVRSARSFVRRALRTATSWTLGRGRGPVSHVLHAPSAGATPDPHEFPLHRTQGDHP